MSRARLGGGVKAWGAVAPSVAHNFGGPGQD